MNGSDGEIPEPCPATKTGPPKIFSKRIKWFEETRSGGDSYCVKHEQTFPLTIRTRYRQWEVRKKWTHQSCTLVKDHAGPHAWGPAHWRQGGWEKWGDPVEEWRRFEWGCGHKNAWDKIK